MAVPDFPNGFDSWQKTHFEVVEALCHVRSLEEDKQPKSFSEMLDQSATEELYHLANDLTNKFETQNKGRLRDRTLFEEIEDFVVEELRNLPK